MADFPSWTLWLPARRPLPAPDTGMQEPYLGDSPAYLQPFVMGSIVTITLCLILRDSGVVSMKIHNSLLPRQGFDVGDEALGHRYPPPRYTGPVSTPTSTCLILPSPAPPTSP